VKRILFALAGLVVAAVSLAQLTKYKDWDKSPEAYFLTSTERADWKKVATDQDAEQFIALYWAKRGGEAFKQEVARRIGAADQQFKLARYHRGADSVRGRILACTGAVADAEVLVREALAILEPTDAPVLQIEAYLDLGEVLVAAGRIDEARTAYEAARALADEKGGVVTLGAVIRRIEGLDTAQV